MKQVFETIGDIEVPIILKKGEKWYPISYITTKLLLRSGKNSLMSKQNREKYKDYLAKLVINFGEKNIQECTCISESGLILLLGRTRTGRLSIEQRVSQNHLHNYLNIQLLPIDEQDTDLYKEEWLEECDEYTKEIIINELKKYHNLTIRRCSGCGKHYPMTSIFYPIHEKGEKGYAKKCKMCIGKVEFFVHQDRDKKMLKKTGDDLIQAANDNSTELIYESFLSGKIKWIPEQCNNKESYTRIIKYLHHKNIITKENLSSKFLTKECHLSYFHRYFKIDEIYQLLYGDDFYLYSWKYPMYTFKERKLTYEIANTIINNYIKENNVIINNKFKFDYTSLVKKCGLSSILVGGLLKFIVQFWDYQYAGYLFENKSKVYYKDEDNLLFDLKYLIEKDLNINVDKIPLYLTRTTLQRKCNPLYHHIISNKNGSIFKWVDKLYPNKFIELDFDINAHRESFDSDTECFIDELLRENFKSVIYNTRNTNKTVELDGIVPDWLVFNEHGVWIIEYFGMYVERQQGNSSRIDRYIEKTKRKIEQYKKLKGYKFIFLYPDDIESDFLGTRKTIEKMKENPYFTML